MFAAEGKPERILLLLQQPLILDGYHPQQDGRRVCLQHTIGEAYGRDSWVVEFKDFGVVRHQLFLMQ